MPGWIHLAARTVIIKSGVLLSWTLCVPMASAQPLAIPLLHDVTITNGLKNTCVCRRRGCVIYGNAPLTPASFYEVKPDAFETESAVFAALSYARYNLSDGIVYDGKHSFPPDFPELMKSKPSYTINGISLTNLYIRTFTFAVSPTFSTNQLRCTLVSFFRSKCHLPATHLFSFYVNDMTGKVGLDIQDCSNHMRFLLNSLINHPFLDKEECQSQREFRDRIYKKMFGPLNVPSNPPTFHFETNGVGRGESEISVEVDGL